jgi:pantetheine-phosphate adenylyltransferase
MLRFIYKKSSCGSFDRFYSSHIKRTALYAGTFDPPSKGHLDIIGKSKDLFDELYVGVAIPTKKR